MPSTHHAVGSSSSALYGAVFTVALAVYTHTLMPSVPGGDSGELVAEACELGTAHPPGYPLYTLVVHLLTYLPVGSMAWRANEFCAVLGALAAANIAATVFALVSSRRIGLVSGVLRVATPSSSFSSSARDAPWALRAAAGATAGLLYAFSPLVWTYSVGSEVFAMNNFFASLVVLLTVRFADTSNAAGRGRVAALGALVCGLGMCNQHTLILYIIPFVAWILFALRRTLTGRQFLGLAAVFFAGLAPYAYLPIASTTFPKRGAWGDMSTLQGFWRHLRRADYGTFRLYSRDDKTQGLTDRLQAHLADFAERQSLVLVGPLFALVGVWCCIRSARAHGMAFAAGGDGTEREGASSSTSAAGRDILPKRQQQQKNKRKRASKPADDDNMTASTGKAVSTTAAVAASSQGAGADVCLALVGAFFFYDVGFHSLSNLPLDNPLLFGIHARFWMQPNILLFVWVGVGLLCLSQAVACRLSTPSSSALPAALVALEGLLVVAQVWKWLPLMDQRENRYLEHYARGILESIPPKSLFFTNYDQQWTASRYLHVCEGVRPDLPFINLSMMTFWWFYRQRELFPEIVFPRAYLAGEGTAQYKRGEGFTFKELLDANIDRFPGGAIYFVVGLVLRMRVCHPDSFPPPSAFSTTCNQASTWAAMWLEARAAAMKRTMKVSLLDF